VKLNTIIEALVDQLDNSRNGIGGFLRIELKLNISTNCFNDN
jgi:hypothetical protein